MNAPDILDAMADVYTRHPDRWTTRSYARDQDGGTASFAARNAYAFCANGFLMRAQAEGLINRNVMVDARAMLSNVCGPQGICYINDNEGREAIIAKARAAAARWRDPVVDARVERPLEEKP